MRLKREDLKYMNPAVRKQIEQQMEELPKESKYHNERCVVDGIAFDSRKEANRYCELILLEKVGEIVDLRLQVRYKLTDTISYICDFEYKDKDGKLIVEDVKGVKTDAYKLKRSLMKTFYDIDILET